MIIIVFSYVPFFLSLFVDLTIEDEIIIHDAPTKTVVIPLKPKDLVHFQEAVTEEVAQEAKLAQGTSNNFFL